jgi:formylglycine-generating enzyme required for sulfatase activity
MKQTIRMLLFVGPMLLMSGLGWTQPSGKEYTNSLGQHFIRIEAGEFLMGVYDRLLPEELRQPFDNHEERGGTVHRRYGDFDEWPRHKVSITRPFYLGACEVTNAQYEQFDPSHRDLRGKLGFSSGDEEAVVFVSWQDALNFCKWISQKEGIPYRLPTEAEWEYACRAGTLTPFHTGDSLPQVFHKNPRQDWFPHPSRTEKAAEIDLTVGKTPPNPWGLFDMHGNVEEWCMDWYGPYEPGDQINPVGRADGDFRVTRGGSHSTELYYLRSANRMGTVPEERNWLIGFRLVIGKMPPSPPLPAPPPPLNQQNVTQAVPVDIRNGPDPEKPYFKGPRQYVNIPPQSYGPLFYYHNHDPALVECPNGDLLAIWYTCTSEKSRELGLAASRLRYGQEQWEPASPFWDAPDRNDHAPALWFDGDKTIYHFVGLSVASTWGNLAIIMRTSTDSGATWSKARIILPEHHASHMPIESVFRSREGWIFLPSDAARTETETGSTLYVSRDNGATWTEACESLIAGIHAGVVQLTDGRLMALGRGNDIDNRMPKSISSDMGKTWTYSASPFPPISGGQRLVLIRLQEGPLFFASFAGSEREPDRTILLTDASGKQRPVSGLFGALSYDDGETWPVIRLISDDGPGRYVEQLDGCLFLMNYEKAEPKGYLSVCQTADGVIQLISSRQHYAFNKKWLETPPPAVP